MIVIWRGFGLLVLPALVLGAALGIVLGVKLTGLLGLGDGAALGALMVAMAGGFATLGCYGLQRLLARTDKGRVVVDKATGDELVLNRGDALFFIPVRWWTRIVAAISVLAVGAIGAFGLFGN